MNDAQLLNFNKNFNAKRNIHSNNNTSMHGERVKMPDFGLSTKAIFN